MKIVLLSGEYSADRAAKAFAVATAAARSGLMLGTDAVLAAAPEPDPTVTAPPVLRIADYIGREGQFAHVQLMKKLAGVMNAKPAAVVLDGVTNIGRYSDLDAHGRGADHLTAAVAKALYWDTPRPVLVHFCLPSMHSYFVREWAKFAAYTPIESPVAGHTNTPLLRVQPLIHRAAGRLHPYHLRTRVRQRFEGLLVGRLALKVLRTARLIRR